MMVPVWKLNWLADQSEVSCQMFFHEGVSWLDRDLWGNVEKDTNQVFMREIQRPLCILLYTEVQSLDPL